MKTKRNPDCHPLRWLVLLFAVAATACTSLTYQPKATVGASPERLPLRVEVHDLQDDSPADDRSRNLGGTAATAKDTLSGELSTSVTDAILENFRSDEVFAEVSRRPEQTDLVLGGTIRRFYGKARYNGLGWASVLDPYGVGSLLMLLGLPVYSSFGGVELELTFDTPAGERIAAYRSLKEFSDYRSIYRAPLAGIGTRVDLAFSDVIADVRQQMLADREKLLRARKIVIEEAQP